MLEYLSLDIMYSSQLTVFLELRSRKIVRFSEQIMSKDKYPNIFSRQMKAIVFIIQIFFATSAVLKLGDILEHFPVFQLWNIHSRDAFGPITMERKYLMDYKYYYAARNKTHNVTSPLLHRQRNLLNSTLESRTKIALFVSSKKFSSHVIISSTTILFPSMSLERRRS